MPRFTQRLQLLVGDKPDEAALPPPTCTVSNPPTQAEVQALLDYLNAALHGLEPDVRGLNRQTPKAPRKSGRSK